jgi:hypothetical protein
MTRLLAALQARIYANHKRRTIASNKRHRPPFDKPAVTTRRGPKP